MKYILMLMLSISALFAVVDINKASKDELMSLKGVGDKKADAIVEYRKSIKCFKSVDELKGVKGIGDKFIANNANNLSASKCAK